MYLNITREGYGSVAEWRISLALFDDFVENGFSSRLYKEKETSYRYFSKAIGIINEKYSKAFGKHITLELIFHGKQLAMPAIIMASRSAKCRDRWVLERAREIHRSIARLRDKIYDAPLIVDGVLTTLSYHCRDECLRPPIIVYEGTLIQTDHLWSRPNHVYVHEITKEMKKIRDNIAMLRCAAAMREVCPRLFEPHLLRIVKKFL